MCLRSVPHLGILKHEPGGKRVRRVERVLMNHERVLVHIYRASSLAGANGHAIFTRTGNIWDLPRHSYEARHSDHHPLNMKQNPLGINHDPFNIKQNHLGINQNPLDTERNPLNPLNPLSPCDNIEDRSRSTHHIAAQMTPSGTCFPRANHQVL